MNKKKIFFEAEESERNEVFFLVCMEVRDEMGKYIFDLCAHIHSQRKSSKYVLG